jgi:hypothetical protein
LVTTADPQLEALIARDVRLLGQPYRGTDLYRILAAAAFRAGPPAVDMVRRELAQVHEQPLHIFEGAVAEMAARRASAGR